MTIQPTSNPLNAPDPAALAAAQRAADDAELKRKQDEAIAAQQAKPGAGQEPDISGMIFAFIKWLFSDFLKSGSGAGDGGPEEPPQTLRERVTLGTQVVNSGALTTWAEFQRDHKGEKVDYQSPVAGNAQITSPFGLREQPKAGASTDHKGVDIGARGNTRSPDILAAADGVVLFAGARSGYGKAVILGHADGTQTLYGHITGEKMPALGTQVAQGQVIGVMGSEGVSTGNHLHFEHLVNNKPVQPIVAGKPLQMGQLLRGETSAVQLASAQKVPAAATSTKPAATPLPVTDVAVGTTPPAPVTPKVAASKPSVAAVG